MNGENLKWCKVCGKIIPYTSRRRSNCSDSCAKLAKLGHAAYKDAPRFTLSLSETAREARKEHKSYGKYVAENEHPVKVRRFPKENEGGEK